MRESSLKPGAQSATSSAAGLFQFVDQTWLGLVKSHGGKYGLSSMADAISVGSDGHYHAANDADRQAILALQQESADLRPDGGRICQGTPPPPCRPRWAAPVCGGELYAAHFLGPDAACKLIRTNQSDAGASAASLLPNAAGRQQERVLSCRRLGQKRARSL